MSTEIALILSGNNLIRQTRQAEFCYSVCFFCKPKTNLVCKNERMNFMSYWTHIVAAIDVDTYLEEKDIETVVEAMLENAPSITGSEGDVDIFVNVLSGYNCSMGRDCSACPYKDTIEQFEDGGFGCYAEEDFECPSGEYQTRVVITIIGDLRGRQETTTHKEWDAFNNYVAKEIRGKRGFGVRNCTCSIQSE